jgi:hypothetical protein
MSDVLNTASIRAQTAWQRLKNSATESWEDWKQIGEAYRAAQSDIYYRLNINSPHGKGYQREIKAWKVQYQLDDVDDSVWSKLNELVQILPNIEEWRSTILTLDQRLKWSHPNTMWNHWKGHLRNKVASFKSQAKKSDAQRANEAERQVEQLKTQIKEVEAERDGNTIVGRTTPQHVFDLLTRLWPKTKCRQLAELLMQGEYPDPSASPSGSKKTPRTKKTKPQADEHARTLHELKAMRGETDPTTTQEEQVQQ